MKRINYVLVVFFAVCLSAGLAKASEDRMSRGVRRALKSSLSEQAKVANFSMHAYENRVCFINYAEYKTAAVTLMSCSNQNVVKVFATVGDANEHFELAGQDFGYVIAWQYGAAHYNDGSSPERIAELAASFSKSFIKKTLDK